MGESYFRELEAKNGWIGIKVLWFDKKLLNLGLLEADFNTGLEIFKRSR